jgi:hypothetical protein
MPQLAKFGSTLDDLFAPVRFAAASAVFFPPIVRDMYLWLGCIEAGRKTLSKALGQKSLSVAILPGGEREQLLVCPDSSPFEDVVPPTDGLFRLALAHGVPLVPCFSFGERRAYTASDFLLKQRLNLMVKHRIGIPWAWGCHAWFPFVPNPVAVTIVIGKPLSLAAAPLGGASSSSSSSSGSDNSSGVTSADKKDQDADKAAVAALRARYLAAVEELFEAHKSCDEVAKRKKLRWIERPRAGGKGE